MHEEDATVTFNCQTHSVTVNKSNFNVSNGVTLNLTLNLKITGSGCSAAFPPGSLAFDFPSGGPPGFRVTRNSDTQVVLTETNNNPNTDAEEYCFKAVVRSGGTDYPSVDPTITNLGGGG